MLLANYIDPTQMRNALSMWLAREMGIPYSNHIIPVNVTFNGHSLGAFNLSGKIGINAGSVDIDETKGILFELSTEYDEKYKFHSSTYGLPVMVKDPDFDELAADDPSWGTPYEHLAVWQTEFNMAETLTQQGRGFEAFDLDSFVDYILLCNIVHNDEIGHPKSLYIHKAEPGNGCKWQFGPVWDFDATFNIAATGNSHSTPCPYSESLWINSLFNKLVSTQGFMERYKERFK